MVSWWIYMGISGLGFGPMRTKKYRAVFEALSTPSYLDDIFISREFSLSTKVNTSGQGTGTLCI